MEGNIKFSYQYNEHSPKVEITLRPDSTLSEMLEEFDKFLKAAGYEFHGFVDINEEGITDDSAEDPIS